MKILLLEISRVNVSLSFRVDFDSMSVDWNEYVPVMMVSRLCDQPYVPKHRRNISFSFPVRILFLSRSASHTLETYSLALQKALDSAFRIIR